VNVLRKHLLMTQVQKCFLVKNISIG